MGAALKGPWDDDPESAPVHATVKGPWDEDEDAPGALESWVRGAHQAASLGFSDEMEGAAGAVGDLLTGKGFDYAKRRDEARARIEAAKTAHPDAFTGGQVGGTIGSALIPVPGGAAKTLLGSVGRGAATGAAMGLGESEADLTKGEVGKAALDTGLGGLVGGAVGAVAHGAGKVVDAVRGRAAAGIRGAEADAAAQANAAAQKALRSATGAVGGEAAAGLNAVAKAEEVVANASGHYTPTQVAQAKAWLADPAVAGLRQNAAQNVLDRGADRLVGSLQSAENVLSQAQQNATPQAVESAAEEALANPVARQVWPRVKNYASRAIPPIVGASIGGIPGAILGFGAGAVMGNPGTALANMLKSPAVRKMAWQAVQSGAGALGRFGPALQRAATELGIGGARALHESLLDSDPEYRAAVGSLLEQTQGGQ